MAPIDFKKDEVVEIRGVKMTSTKTQLPYEYFSLPFCQPEAGVTYQQLNLGEVLRGDRIVDTAYDVKMDQRYIFSLYQADCGFSFQALIFLKTLISK